MLCDLHIHSCLSPCADDDMTPATVVGLRKLAGATFVAVTDHNSALNLPAALAAAQAYGIGLIPGIEVTTSEEIHLLCYFPTVELALEMGNRLFETLPISPYDPEIWGRQIVMNHEDEELYTVDRLLSAAVALNIYEVKALCESLGGVAVPAHADAESYSIMSVLGFCPEDLDFVAFELKRPEKYEEYVSRGLLPVGKEIFASSDAHSRECLDSRLWELPEDSVLMKLI